jgi:inorganic pyrophosphatase
VLIRSSNTTVKGSKGLVSTSDAVYTSLPADSRKPAAPIDPSSELQSGALWCAWLGADWAVSKSFFISSASA